MTAHGQLYVRTRGLVLMEGCDSGHGPERLCTVYLLVFWVGFNRCEYIAHGHYTIQVKYGGYKNRKEEGIYLAGCVINIRDVGD